MDQYLREMMKCYGKYRKTNEKCQSCQWKDYCIQAVDPKFHQHRHSTPSIVNIDSNLLEKISGYIEDNSTESINIAHISAQIINETFGRIIEYSDNDVTTIGILVARFSGMSYRNIADAFIIPKSTVEFKINCIGRKNKVLAEHLKSIKCTVNKRNFIKHILNGTNPARHQQKKTAENPQKVLP